MSARVRSVAVNPLTRPQMSRMVESMRPDHDWSAALVQRIVARADGVPLFLEELTRAVLEAGLVPGTTAVSTTGLAPGVYLATFGTSSATTRIVVR